MTPPTAWLATAQMTERRGDWLQTFTGRQFWPIDPRPEDVCIDDIAAALSKMCRYGGHCADFYSVAEHCCLMFDVAPDHLKLWALLHDASEAYIVDVPKPLKPFLSEYKGYERNVMAAICQRFGLTTDEPPEIKILDERILGDELEQAMLEPPVPWGLRLDPLGVKLKFWTPNQARVEFLSRFGEVEP